MVKRMLLVIMPFQELRQVKRFVHVFNCIVCRVSHNYVHESAHISKNVFKLHRIIFFVSSVAMYWALL